MGKTYKDQRAFEVKNQIRKSERIRQQKLPKSTKDRLLHEVEDNLHELDNKGYTGEHTRKPSFDRHYKKLLDGE